jgi:hypothetical protein
MRSVVMGGKLNFRFARVLPTTAPPGTSIHTDPVQDCTLKSRMPKLVAGVVSFTTEPSLGLFFNV